jgi:hypothetical protein
MVPAPLLGGCFGTAGVGIKGTCYLGCCVLLPEEGGGIGGSGVGVVGIRGAGEEGLGEDRGGFYEKSEVRSPKCSTT